MCIYTIFFITLTIFTYYAGIMLSALATLLCSNVCWHNRLKPNCECPIIPRIMLAKTVAYNSQNYAGTLGSGLAGIIASL